MSLRILHCLDGSSCSDAAGGLAIDLAATLADAELTLLHVVAVAAPSGRFLKDLGGRLGFEPVVVRPEVEQEHLERGRALLDRVAHQAEASGVQAKTVLARGAVAERILRYSAHSDLLVCGWRGQTEDRHPGQGGAAVMNLLQDASLPVIFVPDHVMRVRSLALGYDGSIGAAHASRALRHLFEEAPVEVHAIYVGEEADAAVLAEVDLDLPTLPVHRHVVQGEPVHRVLAQTAQELGADLLAVGFRGRSPFHDFLFGTATDFILRDARLAVLVAH